MNKLTQIIRTTVSFKFQTKDLKQWEAVLAMVPLSDSSVESVAHV